MTAAARKLNIAKTVVSSHIQRLEAEIGASLLIRTTRSLNLTEAGSTFFNASRKILRDVDKAVSAAAQDANEPQGTLKITSPVDYGIAVVGPVIAALSNRFPDLQIELITVDRILDLVEEGIDLAIRLGRLADSSHRTIRIGNFTRLACRQPRVPWRNAVTEGSRRYFELQVRFIVCPSAASNLDF